MTKIILSAILLLILPIQVWSEDELKGSFTCKVKSQKIMAIEEGIPKEYSGIKDGVKIGDTLILGYSYIKFSKTFKLDPKPFLSSFISAFLVNARELQGKTIYFSDKNISLNDEFRHGRIMSLNDDKIQIQDSRLVLTLIRYYKNDWSAMFVDTTWPEKQTWIMGLNCRHTTDKFDEIFAHLESKGWGLKK